MGKIKMISIINYLKDCLFPIFCIECKVEGEWWCKKCIKKNELGVFYCPVCHLKNTNGKACQKCQSSCYLNGVAAFFDYDEHAPVGQLIKKFKYNFAYDISRVWQTLSDEASLKIIDQLQINACELSIVPIPLHIRRYRERGFNQSELIADAINEQIKNKITTSLDTVGLCRSKITKQQAKLNRKERMENMKDAFIWTKNIPPTRVVILVDDVYTSGSTMQECARVLKKAGAQKVYGLVIARD
ncbi:MAG: hypothetical protein ACD_72C00503G0003 [uncultured bacterium]|nr:MAG: hypothetical protein ACD_72C00503G0003 [uncultured bacterium]